MQLARTDELCYTCSMLKTYKYRLYPNKPVERLMNDTLETCRLLYNRILATRRDAWKNDQKSLNTRDTQSMLPLWKQEDERLKQIYSQVLQNVNERVGYAFDEFFRRSREGEIPGFPRFKGKGRYDSFCYPQHKYSFKTKDGETQYGYAFWIEREGKTDYLHMAKLGRVKIKLHRSLPEKIKTLTIKRDRTGKWYATLVCEVQPQIRPPTQCQVGIDFGLHHYAALSDGKLIPNPRFQQEKEKALAKLDRRYSAVLKQCQPFWGKGEQPPADLQRERKRLGKVLCRIHERVRYQRENFCHQFSRDIVNHYDVIFMEDLDTQHMSETDQSDFNKRIRDAAWGITRNFILGKAVEAGRECALVNPYHTSQRCSGCGQLVRKDSSVRVHRCPACGLVIDRDVNAARNILALGLQGVGIQSLKASVIGQGE